MIDVEHAKQVLLEYAKNYDINDGKIALKINHILRVAKISRNIAIAQGLPQEDVELAEVIGLLHDIGRFEQVKRYNTFIDRDSVNHGEYGVKVLFEDGLIEKFKIDDKYYKTIRLSIINHNRNTIEEGITEKELLHCKIIRDSDKIDIFHVLLTDKCINTYNCESIEHEQFSKEIVREFKENHQINYKNRKTPGDIWISHIAYVFDFNFKSSYKIIKEKDYINKMLEMANFKEQETKVQAKNLIEIANKYVDSCIS
ncbi:MAG: HD domain-containing protein [Clostridia bacterium]|nr:HD domain-containing protein [Clostridia bacterium]